MGEMHSLTIDRLKPLSSEPATGHNRWHPDIKPCLRVQPGDIVTLETRDALDGMVTRDTKAADLERIEMGRIHPLTGPVYIEGAEPGDVLEVHIISINPQSFGFTLLIPGFGILRDYFPKPFIVSWELSEHYAVSPQLPNVKIPAAPFMGVMGVAPSHDLLNRSESREADLLGRGGMVLPPSPVGAVPDTNEIAGKGLRTVPPRENGGNIDIKHLTAGSTVYFPVFVPGALFSAGDAHFAQGDCESCGTAIEMGATLTVRFAIRKQATTTGLLRGLQFTRREGLHPPIAAGGRFYATTGLPITAEGRNESEDLTLAAKNALLSMIDYLVFTYHYSREQAYALTSVAVDLHVSELVDVPNVLVSAFLPLEVFQ